LILLFYLGFVIGYGVGIGCRYFFEDKENLKRGNKNFKYE